MLSFWMSVKHDMVCKGLLLYFIICQMSILVFVTACVFTSTPIHNMAWCDMSNIMVKCYQGSRLERRLARFSTNSEGRAFHCAFAHLKWLGANLWCKRNILRVLPWFVYSSCVSSIQRPTQMIPSCILDPIGRTKFVTYVSANHGYVESLHS